MLGAKNHLRRDDSVLNDLLFVVDILEEEIQRGNALHQSPLNVLPLFGRYDPWDWIKRENSLGALIIRINGESDPALQESLRGELIRALDFAVLEFAHPPEERLVVRTDR